MSSSLWKIMTEFNFMCDVAAMGLVKLDIKKQRYSYISYLYSLGILLFPLFTLCK